MNIIEIEGHKIALDYLNEFSTVFDCGACVGEFTETLFSLCKCKYYLYEPDRRNVRILNQRFNGNKNIHVIDKGISTKIGMKEFYYGDYITASSFFKSHRGLNGEHRTVGVTTIDNEINTYGDVDLVKFDLEGSEIDVIPSINVDMLSKIKQITIEFHPQSNIDGYTQERINVCRDHLKKKFIEILYEDKGNDGHHGLYLNRGI